MSRLVVATGGLSIAKIGATSFGYDLAPQFGLNIEPTRAALVPLSFGRTRPQTLVRSCRSLDRSHRSVSSSKRNVRPAFSKICCSPIAVSAVRPFSRSLLIGMARNRFISTFAGSRSRRRSTNRSHRDGSTWKTMLREVLPRRFADRWLETYPLTGNSDRAFAEAERQLHRVGGQVRRDRRLWKSRGHRRRRRYRRTFCPNIGVFKSTGPFFYRRSCRRHRSARRIQFPVGLVFRILCRTGGMRISCARIVRKD